MATTNPSATETQLRERLAEIKHRYNLAKRAYQVERMSVRIDLLRHRAQQLPEATKADLRAKRAAFEREVTALKAVAGQTTKAHRAAASAAWNDLRDAFNAAYEQAGLGEAKRAKKAAKKS